MGQFWEGLVSTLISLDISATQYIYIFDITSILLFLNIDMMIFVQCFKKDFVMIL